MKMHNKEVSTSPFKTLYECAKDAEEFTIHDTSIDIEFYIYKGESFNLGIEELIVNTQEVHFANNALFIDFFSWFEPKRKELWDEFAFESRYTDWEDDDFLYDLIEDVQQVVNAGYESFSKRLVNILKGDAK